MCIWGDFMKYYYDCTMLGITLKNTKIIIRTSNNFLDCERFDLSTYQWINDSNFSCEVFEGQKEVEEISEKQAINKINKFMSNEYKRICDKLGFIPSEYRMPETDTEDDSIENPFTILTVEELNFLFKNDYMNNHPIITRNIKFNKNQIEFMKKIGLSIDFLKKITDSDIEIIEEKVSDYLQRKGFDENYEPTDEGKICESILDEIE